MKNHILEKRREYVRLYKRAYDLGVSRAEFRYHVVAAANESTYLIEQNGLRADWADECLKAAEEFVYAGEQQRADQEVELAYEQSLENQGEPDEYS
jgi:hypothetical protein